MPPLPDETYDVIVVDAEIDDDGDLRIEVTDHDRSPYRADRGTEKLYTWKPVAERSTPPIRTHCSESQGRCGCETACRASVRRRCEHAFACQRFATRSVFVPPERDDVTPAARPRQARRIDIGATRGVGHVRATVGAGTPACTWARDRSGRRGREVEQAVLVLGPPRSGKTSSIVVPTVLGAPGAVVSTSTKPDVLRATAHARRTVGPCLLYDPSGTVDAPPGVDRVRWSPVQSCRTWDDALLVARSLVGAARPGGGGHDGAGTGGRRPLDRAGRSPPRPRAARRRARRRGPRHRAVVGRPPQRRARLGILDRNGAARPATSWPGSPPPTPGSRAASGRRRRASWPPTAARPPWPPRWRPTSTPGPSATRRPRSISVPRAGTRPWPRPWSWACSPTSAAPPTPGRPPPGAAARGPAGRPAPVVLALDEVANIAPIPDLPGMVSEGGWPGTSHPGLSPGPVPGPGPVGRRRPRASSRCSAPPWCCPGSGTCAPSRRSRPWPARKRCAPGR